MSSACCFRLPPSFLLDPASLPLVPSPSLSRHFSCRRRCSRQSAGESESVHAVTVSLSLLHLSPQATLARSLARVLSPSFLLLLQWLLSKPLSIIFFPLLLLWHMFLASLSLPDYATTRLRDCGGCCGRRRLVFVEERGSH